MPPTDATDNAIPVNRGITAYQNSSSHDKFLRISSVSSWARMITTSRVLSKKIIFYKPCQSYHTISLTLKSFSTSSKTKLFWAGTNLAGNNKVHKSDHVISSTQNPN